MSSEPQGGEPRLTHHEHQQEQSERREYDRRATAIREAIDRGYRTDNRSVDRLLGCVRLLATELDITSWSAELYTPRADSLSLPFHERITKVVIRAIEEGDGSDDAIRSVVDGDVFDSIWKTFLSLETAAAVEGYLPTELEDVQPTYGFETQLGERYVRAESAATGDLQLRDDEDELKSILCAGGKGSGKSTALEKLTLDSYARGHKIVDLVDFFKSENAAYDIPQQDNGKGLISARDGMGMATGFDDIEAGFAWLDGEPDDDLVTSPELEVLAPLSPGLAKMDVPTIPQVNQQTVKPFTIPASELTFRQLVMLLHHSTRTQENHLRSAHQELRDSGEDWTLADLAETVRTETNAGDKVADRIETSLQTAQSKSFIRDKECGHALNWTEVMRDSDTITSFTVHPMQEKSDHLVVLSYLIDSLFEARKDLLSQHFLSEFPSLSVVMREMHEVAPRQKSEQESESTIEGFMIDTLGEMFALTRHADMEVLADTQKFYRQLSADVSGLFDHILAFQGHVPDIKRIFKTRIDNTNPAEKVAQFREPGQCAFVSENGYRMPIQFAPPRCHHLEADTDGNGLGFRARVDDTPERLKPAPWDADVPDRLAFEDVPDHPIDRFLKEYVDYTGEWSDWELMEDIHEAYLGWAEDTGCAEFEQRMVTKRLKEVYDDIGDPTSYTPSIDGRRPSAHRHLELKWRPVSDTSK